MRSVLNQKNRYGDYIVKIESLSDRDLFAHIAAGEEPALDELYKRYRSQVYRFLVHRTSDAQAAEELLQDVFLAAWQGARKFRGGAAVKTWLLRVAYYRAATWVNQVRRMQETELSETLLAPGRTPDERIDETWENAWLHAALAELSDHHRTAIELVFYHELTYKEAARVVDCPVGTMKSRVSYALKILNGSLMRAEPETP